MWQNDSRWRTPRRGVPTRAFACAAILGAALFAQAQEDFNAKLEPIRAKHALPSLTAAAVRDGKVVAIGAVGVRKSGATEPVTTHDLWHIGSCTKSMTATLAAMLVDQHKLKWETTVGEIFPEWHDMNPEWRAVTLEQLLTHRAGAPHDAPPDLWAQAWKKIGLPKQQRLAFVHGLVTRAPEAPPGTKFIYSNQGYSIAGAMIERVTGLAWETLMREMLFEPLAIQSAGFGAPGTPGKTDEPWGHVFENGKLKPIPPGPDADNPAAIGPGGIVHLSISDFARYAQWHARGVFNGRRLLSDASFSKIHTSAAGGDYAMGWGVYQRDWSGGVTFTHNGSNTMWFAVMWVSPAKDAAFVAATNVAGDEAEKACDEAVFALIQRVLLHQ